MLRLLGTSPASSLAFRSSDHPRRLFFSAIPPNSRCLLLHVLPQDGVRSTSLSVLPFRKRISNSAVQESKSADSDLLPSSPLQIIAPYVQSEWKLILIGWLCSGISVLCLSKLVPEMGKLSSGMCRYGTVEILAEVLKMASFFLVRSAACYFQQAFLWEAALKAVCKIRVDVFGKLLYRDLGFFEGRGGVPSGEISHRITAEAKDVADTVFALLNTSLPNGLQLLAMSTQMIIISPVLSIISALVIPLMCVVVALLGERLRRISQEANSSAARLSAYLNEVLQSMLVVKANNAESNESSRFQNLALDDLTSLLKKRQAKVLVPEIVKLMHIGGTLFLCSAAVLVSSGLFDSSRMVSFTISLALLVDPIEGVGKTFNELKQGEPAIERLFALANFSPQVIERPDAVDKDSVKGDVKFCDVTFRYEENAPPVLDRLDLHIRPGETIAFIGPSGGGKTTITKLLLRLYDPQSGKILLDDEDVRDIRLASLRRHVGLVSQDVALFSGTVAENIGYRDLMRGIKMELVGSAARAANAVEFIEKLPDGYDTDLGQRGSVLSGGQRQRLAIARALYQESSILILDEATSALDSKSEMLVRQAVESLTKNHTVLVIAHRMETVLMADRIFVLNGGRLEEVKRSTFLAGDGQRGVSVANGLIV